MPRCKICKEFAEEVCEVDVRWHNRQAKKIQAELAAKAELQRQFDGLVRRVNNRKRFQPVEKTPVAPVLDHMDLEAVLVSDEMIEEVRQQVYAGGEDDE